MKTLKTYILLIITGILLVNTAKAQIFVELGTGYAMPMLHNFNSHMNENLFVYDNKVTGEYSYNQEPLSSTNINNGLFFRAETGYKFKQNIVASVNVSYLNNNTIKFLYKPLITESCSTIIKNNYIDYIPNVFQHLETCYRTIEEYSVSSLKITPKFSYFYQYKKFGINASVGCQISLNTVFENYTWTETGQSHYENFNPADYLNYPDGAGKNTEIKKFKYIFKPDYSPYFSVAFNYCINKNFAVFFLTEYAIFFDNLRKIPIAKKQYYRQSINTVSGQGETIIVNDVIDETVYKTELTGSMATKYNLANLNFSIGIRYTFNKKQKND